MSPRACWPPERLHSSMCQLCSRCALKRRVSPPIKLARGCPEPLKHLRYRQRVLPTIGEEFSLQTSPLLQIQIAANHLIPSQACLAATQLPRYQPVLIYESQSRTKLNQSASFCSVDPADSPQAAQNFALGLRSGFPQLEHGGP